MDVWIEGWIDNNNNIIETLHMILQHLYLIAMCPWTACQTCSSFSIDLPQQSCWEKKSTLWPLYTFRMRFRDHFRPQSSCRGASLVQTSWGFSKAEFMGCLAPSVPLSWHFQEGISTPASSLLSCSRASEGANIISMSSQRDLAVLESHFECA